MKALSYAKAAVALCPHNLEEEDVIGAFKEVVGRSLQEVATTLAASIHVVAVAHPSPAASFIGPDCYQKSGSSTIQNK